MSSKLSDTEISEHKVRLLLVFQQQARWLTNKEAAGLAKIYPRTASMHIARLVRLGVLNVAKVYPGWRFRLAEEPPQSGLAYLEEWNKAREVFGL